jgi:alkylhydroperoxidase/carboxymuconolactone decarboxylase family protein YurZ
MDDKTKLLISLGAAVASNCIPCFEHFMGKTEAVGLTSEEIQQAVDVADQVKMGARLAIRKAVNDIMKTGVQRCDSASENSCCG